MPNIALYAMQRKQVAITHIVEIFILYFDECLKETGDKALYSCAYTELDATVRCFSAEPFKPKLQAHRSSGGASD